VTSTRRVDRYRVDSSRLHSLKWHSDSCYEPVPSDYTLLKIHTLPASGGDTLWANGYEVYSRLSPPLARMLEGLNALHDVRSHYTKAGEDFGNKLRTGERGHPLNTGQDLCAIHPVIRVSECDPENLDKYPAADDQTQYAYYHFVPVTSATLTY
jgi:alpha-ketoglutarate-dependent taurine dioxygenase